MGGGSLFLNGKEILTLDSYLDKVYPKEIEFVFPSGFNPGEKIGGDWTCVAQDIVLPLGSSATITYAGNLQFQNGLTGNIYTLNTNQATEAGVGKVIDAGLWSSDTNVYLNPGQPLRYNRGLSLDLSSATNAKLVSIWKRVE